MRPRTTFRGSAVVAVGALIVGFSLILPWGSSGINASDSGVTALLIPLAVLTLALVAVSSHRGIAWPFLYTRVLGCCAIVGVVYAVFWEGGRVRFGILLAALGAVMIAAGSSSAVNPHGERRPPA